MATDSLFSYKFSDYVQGAQSQHDVAAKVYTYFDATTLYPNVLQICKQLSLDPNMTVQALVAQHLEGLAVPPKQATIPTQTISHAQYLQRGHVVHAIVHEIVSRHLLHDANPVVDLFSIDAFVARVSSLKDAFPPSWLHALAIKANPLSGILLAAKPLGVGLETASIAEATHALNLGFAPRSVIVDSPCKTTDDLKALLELGCYLNLDNVDEIHKVHSLLGGTVPDALLGLRINPVVGGGAIAASSTATATSKFGVPWTAATDADLIALYRDHAWLQGVHRAVAFAKQINQALGRHQIQVVDIGGGVPTVYNGMAEEAVEFADYAALLQASVPGEFRVVTEFGRSVFAKAGITLSRDIAGPLCFSGDVLARDVHLPQIEAGDYLVMHDTGAYNMAMYSKFNSIQAPAVYAYRNHGKLMESALTTLITSACARKQWDSVESGPHEGNDAMRSSLATFPHSVIDDQLDIKSLTNVSTIVSAFKPSPLPSEFDATVADAIATISTLEASAWHDTAISEIDVAGSDDNSIQKRVAYLLLKYKCKDAARYFALLDKDNQDNFNVLDTNGDGLVSEAEMHQLLLNILGVYKSVLKDLLEHHTKHWTAKHSKQLPKLLVEFEITLKVSEKIRCTWHFAGVPPIPEEDKFKDPPPVPPRFTMSIDELRTSLVLCLCESGDFAD
ncbi:hypothetical protein DYB38_003467 [Aphanomyces astaci]|uniref:EF-hand domain-containing protein n=1 Tax=Aphanomyces astaci TaxID=112090 RepID=A0A397C1H8_APHAT|nr:hypothetical protein DYB38_003467 [Aphanomyces astaci]